MIMTIVWVTAHENMSKCRIDEHSSVVAMVKFLLLQSKQETNG